MTILEGFQHHFNIMSKIVFCGFYNKEIVAFTLAELKCDECLSAISVTVWDTFSVASRARIEITRLK